MDSPLESVVSWRQFVSTMVPLIVMPIAISWALVNAHGETPTHTGAVHIREFERVVTELRDLKAEMQNMRKDLREIRNQIYAGRYPKMIEE